MRCYSMELLARTCRNLPVCCAVDEEDAGIGLLDGPQRACFGRLEMAYLPSLFHSLVNHSPWQEETKTQQPRVAMNRDVKRRKRSHCNDRLNTRIAGSELNRGCGAIGTPEDPDWFGEEVLNVNGIQHLSQIRRIDDPVGQ